MRAHDRQVPQSGERRTADPDTAAAAAADTATRLPEDWEPRPVTFAETADLLRSVGGGLPRDEAPTVSVIRDDRGVLLTVAAHRHPNGDVDALEIVDPTDYQGWGDPGPASTVVNARDLCDWFDSTSGWASPGCLHDLDFAEDGGLQVGPDNDLGCRAANAGIAPDDRTAWDTIDRQFSELRKAESLLVRLGDHHTDPRVSAQQFAAEAVTVGQVCPPHSHAGRDTVMFGHVHFRDSLGRPRMGASDSVRLIDSAVGVPAEFAAAEVSLPVDSLNRCAEVLTAHTGPAPTRLATAGNRTDTDRPGFPVRSVRAGQVHYVFGKTELGRAPGYGRMFENAGSSRRTVEIDAKAALSTLGKGHRRKQPKTSQPISLRIRSENGETVAVEWERLGRHRTRQPSAGQIPAAGKPAKDTPLTGIDAWHLTDTLRLVGSDRAEIRQWSTAKPLVFVPAGSPSSLADVDRVTAVMPVRVTTSR